MSGSGHGSAPPQGAAADRGPEAEAQRVATDAASRLMGQTSDGGRGTLIPVGAPAALGAEVPGAAAPQARHGLPQNGHNAASAAAGGDEVRRARPEQQQLQAAQPASSSAAAAAAAADRAP